ncbi:hypothetical protein [Actinocorallia populi]|uniref:hypothetical protein n=1 Tax=Actinocorallia populi TaxID=2079200 RepID=UPI001300757F|nr:hypothetical protein [Actinocorallia populi]
MLDPPPASAPTDAELTALLLITTWSARTGRTLRRVPVGELSAAELVEFWADDQLEPPYSGP